MRENSIIFVALIRLASLACPAIVLGFGIGTPPFSQAEVFNCKKNPAPQAAPTFTNGNLLGFAGHYKAVILACDWKNGVIFWDLARGTQEKVLDDIVRDNKPGCRYAAKVREDLMAMTRGEYLHIINIAQQKTLAIHATRATHVTSLDFSCNRKVVALSTLDGPIWSLRIDGDEKPTTFGDSEEAILSISLSPDGEYLASRSVLRLAPANDEIRFRTRIWRVKDGKELLLPADTFANCRHLMYSPDGRLFATADKETCSFYAVPEYRMIGSIKAPSHDSFSVIQFSGDSRLLAIGGESGTVRIYETKTLSLRKKTQCIACRVGSLCFDNTSKKIAVLGVDMHCVIEDVFARYGNNFSSFEALWQKLGSDDGVEAHDAMSLLVGNPTHTMVELRRLTAGLDKYKVCGALGNLNSDRYVEREKSQKELKNFGPPIWLVDYELPIPKSVECNRRIQAVLSSIEGKELRRFLRLIEVLERINGDESKRFLERIKERCRQSEIGAAAALALEQCK